jgi:hypothetical protein
LQQVVMLRYRGAIQAEHAGKATLEAPSPNVVVQEAVVYPVRLGIVAIEVSSLLKGEAFERREVGAGASGAHRVEYTLQKL